MLPTVVILCLACSTGCSLPASTTARTEYIRQQVPAVPEPPAHYPVRFVKRDGSYCFETPEDAKNLLKNRELDSGYQEDLRGILTNLKGGVK